MRAVSLSLGEALNALADAAVSPAGAAPGPGDHHLEVHSWSSTSAFEEEEILLPFGNEWYCVVLYLVLGLGLQYLLYFVLYAERKHDKLSGYIARVWMKARACILKY